MRTVIMLAVVLGVQAVAQDVNELRAPSPLSAPDPVKQAVRGARGRLFNFDGLPPLGAEKPGTPPRVTRQERSPVAELPVGESDLVVVATVTGMDSRMLPGETGICSEYRATVSKLVFNRSRWSGSSLDILHPGGAVQMGSGRVVRHVVGGQGAPIESGGVYLMFLKYAAGADCFQFLKIWQVREGVVRANADDDLVRVRLGNSQVDGRSLETVLNSLSRVP